MSETSANPLLLTGSNLEKQIELQVEFLQLIHPFLQEDMYHEECVEVRPIRRTEGCPIKSLNLWRADDKAKEYYKKFLYKINGQPVCLYYSVFTFDSKMECYKTDGSKYQKGCINNQNAQYTQILVMDFDGIFEEEFEYQMHVLRRMGIETINIFTGHGYQSIILLNERIYDKHILKDFTELLLRKGFPVDESITDAARVMRMPYSFNCKAYDHKSKYFSNNPKPIPVSLLSRTHRRYAADDIFFLIQSLPDAEAFIEKEEISPTNMDTNEKPVPKNKKTSEPSPQSGRNNLTDLYPMLEGFKLPQAVQNMLFETKEGNRNNTYLFLVPFFRNYLRLDVTTIKDILSIWATRCVPMLDAAFVRKEVERLLNYDFDGNYGRYTESMREEFGSLDVGDKDIYILHSGKILIPNQIFSLYDTLSDGAVKLYFSMKAQEQLSPKKRWEIEEIITFTTISKATFHRNIKELIQFSLVGKHPGNRRAKEKTTYSIYKTYSFPKGFTLFDVGTIENMIHHERKKLTDGEIKLFTYLHYITGNKGEAWKSQDEIAIAIGKKRNSVSEMTQNLHEKEYIIKETYTGEEDNKLHCRYIVNYGYAYKPKFLS